MRRARAVLISILAAPLLGGCGANQPTDNSAQMVALEVREFAEPVARYFYTGVAERARLVIREQAAWTAFWNELTAPYSPRPDVPSVDFSSEMVIVAAMGQRPSGGFAIHIDAVREQAGSVQVLVREVSPGPSCVTTGALTAPATVVRVPRRDRPVVFVERSEVHHCGD